MKFTHKPLPFEEDLFSLPDETFSEAPYEWRDSDPAFIVPEFAALGCGAIKPAFMSRHFLILGETGSGKTKSGIQPLLRAAARYGENSVLAPAALVIDPKRELHTFIREQSGLPEERVVYFDVCKPKDKIHFFEGLSAQDMGSADAIAHQILGLSRYVITEEQTTRDAFWITQARYLFTTLIAVDCSLFRSRGGVGLHSFWSQVAVAVGAAINRHSSSGAASVLSKAWSQLESSMAAMEKLEPLTEKQERIRQSILPHWWSVQLAATDSQRGDAFNRLATALVDQQLNCGKGFFNVVVQKAIVATEALSETNNAAASVHSEAVLSLFYSREKYLLHHKTLMTLAAQYMSDQAENIVLAAYLGVARSVGVSMTDCGFIRGFANLARSTFTSVIAVYSNLIQELTSPALFGALSLNPFESPSGALSVRDLREQGKWLVYAPSASSPAMDIVGRAIKIIFFAATFCRHPEVAARPTIYVCDEFQRFVTADPESGEQNYLDRCRAFRGICILATQSIPSLRYALGGSHAGDPSGEALNALLNNAGNKLLFRTSDPGTSAEIQRSLPAPTLQGRPHIIEVRPPSTLHPGECYFIFSNGKWGRGQISMRQCDGKEDHAARVISRELVPGGEVGKGAEILPESTAPLLCERYE
jgi:type IV secretory pathway TraG/TraD family ATPase VirD4